MSYQSTILADSPQAFYLVNETSGTSLTDSSGNGHTARLAGNYVQNQPGFMSGMTAIFFDGLSGQIVFPASLNVTTFSSITLEYWAKVSARWEYLVVTCNNSTAPLFYSNGALASFVLPPSLFFQGNLFDMAGSFSSGIFQAVALYNVVLTPTQILTHYQALPRYVVNVVETIPPLWKRKKVGG